MVGIIFRSMVLKEGVISFKIWGSSEKSTFCIKSYAYVKFGKTPQNRYFGGFSRLFFEICTWKYPGCGFAIISSKIVAPIFFWFFLKELTQGFQTWCSSGKSVLWICSYAHVKLGGVFGAKVEKSRFFKNKGKSLYKLDQNPQNPDFRVFSEIFQG